jgi:hypothetical protein
MCHSHFIPLVLAKLYRTLAAPGGVLHMTVIDPLPCANLGPLLYRWLADRLLAPLERRHRCTRPADLVPAWLAEANLRGAGSQIVRIPFSAVAPVPLHDKAVACDPGWYAAALRQELRSKMGRMLWIEVWGQFVAGGDWWWDDPALVAECLALDTRWEYYQIEACPDY